MPSHECPETRETDCHQRAHDLHEGPDVNCVGDFGAGDVLDELQGHEAHERGEDADAAHEEDEEEARELRAGKTHAEEHC